MNEWCCWHNQYYPCSGCKRYIQKYFKVIDMDDLKPQFNVPKLTPKEKAIEYLDKNGGTASLKDVVKAAYTPGDDTPGSECSSHPDNQPAKIEDILEAVHQMTENLLHTNIGETSRERAEEVMTEAYRSFYGADTQVEYEWDGDRVKANLTIMVPWVSATVTLHTNKIFLNGKEIKIIDDYLTYERVLELAGLQEGATVIWTKGHREQHEGILHTGSKSVKVVDGMRVEACYTGNA